MINICTVSAKYDLDEHLPEEQQLFCAILEWKVEIPEVVAMDLQR